MVLWACWVAWQVWSSCVIEAYIRSLDNDEQVPLTSNWWACACIYWHRTARMQFLPRTCHVYIRVISIANIYDQLSELRKIASQNHRQRRHKQWTLIACLIILQHACDLILMFVDRLPRM